MDRLKGQGMDEFSIIGSEVLTVVVQFFFQLGSDGTCFVKYDGIDACCLIYYLGIAQKDASSGK